MKNFFKKITGLEKLEQQKHLAEQERVQAAEKLEEAKKKLKLAEEQEELAKLSPKERANRKKEPWVTVLNTHVNKENVRNGFFELDWNEHFVLQLKQEGYGVEGDKDEEIVDRWFRELCANVVVDGDYGGPVQTGSLDIQNVKKNN
jgi:hypothetical protein